MGHVACYLLCDKNITQTKKRWKKIHNLIFCSKKPFSGIVDKIMKEFENRVFPTKKAGRKFMDNYLKEVAIVRKSYQGSQSLEVSHFKILVKIIQNIISGQSK